MANHGFTFGGISVPENPGIEVLDYQYGSSKVPQTYAERPVAGHIAQSTSVHGIMPVGEFLWVKWDVLATGKIYEDRVDLKNRLPSDMDGKFLDFIINGAQLNVYVIEGETSKQFHSREAPDCPVISFQWYRCSRIYPDHWVNF